MIPSLIGVFVLLIGLWLMPKPPIVMLSFVLVCSLFGGSAALYLPALGGSSIPPAQFALLLLGLRVAFAAHAEPAIVMSSLQRNWAIALFSSYGLLAALLFPHVFAGQIELTPQNGRGAGNLFYVTPLQPGPQNITQGIYLLGTAIAAILATAAARGVGAERLLTKVAICLGAAHVAFGVIDAASSAVGINPLAFFRNGAYSQLDQTVNGFHRISGVFPEASVYGGYAGVLLVLNTELWLRNAMPLWSGLCAAALALVLVFCTSSTGYFMLAVYSLVLLCRLVLVPGAGNLRKGAILFMLVFLVANAIFVLVAFRPAFIDNAWDAILDLTVNKSTSSSGIQRAFWAEQGWAAFIASDGLGVGPGSFRSSNIFTAILGTMGVVGVLSLFAYLVGVFAPLHRSTYVLRGGKTGALGPACAWTAVLGLAPGLVAGSSPDPGVFMGLMGGIVFALRDMPARSTQQLRRRRSRGLAPAL